MAIRSFRNMATQEIFERLNTKRARKLVPLTLHEFARVKLARVHAATALRDFAALPGNRFERLSGNRAGQFSIRINDQYRICFEWQNGNAFKVEIVDYH